MTYIMFWLAIPWVSPSVPSPALQAWRSAAQERNTHRRNCVGAIVGGHTSLMRRSCFMTWRRMAAETAAYERRLRRQLSVMEKRHAAAALAAWRAAAARWVAASLARAAFKAMTAGLAGFNTCLHVCMQER